MKLVFCGCKHCRSGMRHKNTSKRITLKVRAGRRKAKEALKRGEEPAVKIAVGYTD